MTVGENIRRIRKEKGLTQKQLGGLCQINEVQIRQYELGKANPKIETLEKIANALQCSVDELRGLDTFENFTPEMLDEHPIIKTVLASILKELFKNSQFVNSIDEFSEYASNNLLTELCNTLFQKIVVDQDCQNTICYLSVPLYSSSKRPYFEKIEHYFTLLNEAGKKEATKRIEELTHLKQYTEK